jgi:hypothetical protein
MSVSEDVKAYADVALEQGKRAMDRAQEVLAQFAAEANQLARKLQERGDEVLANALAGDRKALLDGARDDLDSFRSTVEPYVSQVNALRDELLAKASAYLGEMRKDPRVNKAFGTAESLAGTVAEQVTERIVGPALSLLGRKHTEPATEQVLAAAHAPVGPQAAVAMQVPPAAQPPAAKDAPAKDAPAVKKPPAKKAPAKKAPTAKAVAPKPAAITASEVPAPDPDSPTA